MHFILGSVDKIQIFKTTAAILRVDLASFICSLVKTRQLQHRIFFQLREELQVDERRTKVVYNCGTSSRQKILSLWWRKLGAFSSKRHSMHLHRSFQAALAKQSNHQRVWRRNTTDRGFLQASRTKHRIELCTFASTSATAFEQDQVLSSWKAGLRCNCWSHRRTSERQNREKRRRCVANTRSNRLAPLGTESWRRSRLKPHVL